MASCNPSQSKSRPGSRRAGGFLLLCLLSAGSRIAYAQGAGSASGRAPGAAPSDPAYRTARVEPFRIIGNIYYVGASQHITAYLITTPQGHLLIDTGFEESVGPVRENIEKLGFRLRDIRLLLPTHAHGDHVGGFAQMKELTGAKVLSSAPDAGVMESGGQTDFRNGENWKPTQVDQIVQDGENVSLGGTTLTAHLTPGHTKGCTTWTMVAEDAGRKYNVVFLCGVRMNDNVPVVNNPQYPEMVEDFRRSFQKLKALPCDVFLGGHGYWFDIQTKMQRLKQGGANPFIDPQGYRKYIADMEAYFLEQVKKEGGK
ncbi:MAG TPA: subclass B3 metallo-beta-lactamase [Terriglobia bacterium]|nr:subclass B3 metallo-beta-lactamase [Terriglobia bacterium]